MSTREVEEIKNGLSDVKTGFEAFKEYFPKILKAQLDPLTKEVECLKSEVKSMGQSNECTILKLTEHSAHMDKIETNIEHRFAIHAEESKRKSLALKFWIVSRDSMALIAFAWVLFKQFISDALS